MVGYFCRSNRLFQVSPKAQELLNSGEIQSLVGNDLFPYLLQLFGTVLLGDLSKQRKARVLNTVTVNILYIYHTQ